MVQKIITNDKIGYKDSASREEKQEKHFFFAFPEAQPI